MRTLLIPTLLALLASPAAAQAPSAETSSDPSASRSSSSSNRITYHGRERQLDVAVPRLPVEVKLDGSLDEPQWQQAAMLTGFSQYSPVDRLAAEDSTEVYVMYADHAIYFGIRAFEPHGAPQARLSDRDKIGADDHVMLIIDTFNDKRRAMVFGVN
ncbi:MAG TPA: hypothetical protein VF035_10185, partial [Longimicrobiales bacterium]